MIKKIKYQNNCSVMLTVKWRERTKRNIKPFLAPSCFRAFNPTQQHFIINTTVVLAQI